MGCPHFHVVTSGWASQNTRRGNQWRLGLSLSYEKREDFVKFKFCETSLKLFNLIYVKSKEEAGHRINHQCLWLQLLFVLNVLSSSGSTKIARYAMQKKNKRENYFQAFYPIISNSGLIAVVRSLTMRAFKCVVSDTFLINFFDELWPARNSPSCNQKKVNKRVIYKHVYCSSV